MGGADVMAGRDALTAASLPDYPSPERAVAALRAMRDYSAWLQRPQRVVTRFPVNRRRVERIIRRHVKTSRFQVGEAAAKAILRAYDFNVLPGELAANADEAVEAADLIGYPVAMKIASPDIVHKSDIGGVRLGLGSAEAVRDAHDLMLLRIRQRMPRAQIEGVYVEKMSSRGREVILGMTRDPQFGPMLMFGLGGIFVEVMKDVTFNIAPVTAGEALQMLESTKSFALLKGARGQARVDLDAIAGSLQRISQLVTDFPQIVEMTQRIGEYVAALVDDQSTVEFGIGRIPQAVIGFLKTKKDLGIHTEMFTDAIMDLVESGAVTGRLKTTDRGKIVASFCMGTRRLYDYVHDNPVFAFRPTEYVNDPFVIAQQHRQTAINVALEVDLTGQVCADSLGSRFYSGIGGQVDFNRGAARSPGGKAIIALPSTASDGKISRIVTRLNAGAGVVTTRGDVHYIVTEYGAAYLHGKSVQERAMALIAIAHPDFRARLLREAIEAKYLRPELASVEARLTLTPPAVRTSLVLADGTMISFRSVGPTDQTRMRDLFYALSQQTLYYRFMSPLKHLSKRELHELTFIVACCAPCQ
jgi:hypothetical protein